jgi:uncharacterized protein with PIN domain
MSVATFRFHSELGSFLPRERRETAFDYDCARAATLKQGIESIGVPHTEVGRVLVNGHPATLARTVREADIVEVFPHALGEAPFEAPLTFIADAHLGGLARMLRMLGFDTVYDNGLHDPEIVARSAAERRVVLTRDRELLKCRDVLRGAFVHALKPEAQLREVASRYALALHMKPFSLCLHCNLPLRDADPARVFGTVPERIRDRYSVFTQCVACGRVYWEGSHWERTREVLANALDVAPGQVS